MRTMFVTMLTAGFLAPLLFADWQGQAALLDQLRTAYPRTVLDTGGIKVVKPGTVLVVQLNGLQANPIKSEPFKNKFEDGQVGAVARRLPSQVPITIPNNPFGAKPRYLAVNEKVYLLNLESRGDAHGDALVLTVQTCGTCDPSAADSAKPYLASISFNFYSGFLAATDVTHVETVIGSLLAFPYVAPAVSAQPAPQQDRPPVQAQTEDPGRPTLRHADEVQAPEQTQTPAGEPATPPARFPDLTPPPPPSTETRQATQSQPPTLRRPGEGQAQTQTPVAGPATTPDNIPKLTPPPAPPAGTKPEINTEVKPDIGWTREKLEASLGKPDKTEKSNGQEIYLYKYVKVTLVKSKVAAIESIQ